MIRYRKETKYLFVEYGFLSGLKRGLFMYFLSNGAQPNAKVHRRVDYLAGTLVVGSVAWTDFLFICFDFPSNMSYESMYLDVLDEFMLNVDFSEIGKDLEWFYPGRWRFNHSCVQGGIYCKIFTYLQALSVEGSSWMNKRLVGEVIDRVLSKVDQSSLWLESTWSIIEQIFWEKVVKRLKNKYAKESMTTTAVSEGSVRRKCSIEDNISGLQ